MLNKFLLFSLLCFCLNTHASSEKTIDPADPRIWEDKSLPAPGDGNTLCDASGFENCVSQVDQGKISDIDRESHRRWDKKQNKEWEKRLSN